MIADAWGILLIMWVGFLAFSFTLCLALAAGAEIYYRWAMWRYRSPGGDNGR